MTFGATRHRSWPSGRWAEMVCRATWDETEDVRTFLLAPADGSRVVHEPGQFMTFRIPGSGPDVERSYTIASSADRSTGIEITVKRQDSGAGSGRLHAHLTPGSRIEALGPGGVFTPVRLPEGPFALIGAGSGVTPMLSILRTAADRGLAFDAVFVHVAQSEETAIAADELARLRMKLPLLRTHVHPSPDRASQLTPERLMELIPDLPSRVVMCCGPSGFMDMVRGTAERVGVGPGRYSQESFDFAIEFGAEQASTEGVLRRVVFSRTGTAFDCPEDSTILAAAKTAGIPMQSSCAQGQCGTCKTFKHSGEVAMTHKGGIRQREIDRGFILPCTSWPRSDVVLDR